MSTMGNRLRQLAAQGQSVWQDNITRGQLQSGRLRELIERDGISGVTSNPSIFEKAIRGSDLAVRLGGDEFMLLLPECKPNEVHLILNRLTGITLKIDGFCREITFSSGWTNYQGGDSAEEIMKRADEALYITKRENKQKNKEGALLDVNQ